MMLTSKFARPSLFGLGRCTNVPVISSNPAAFLHEPFSKIFHLQCRDDRLRRGQQFLLHCQCQASHALLAHRETCHILPDEEEHKFYDLKYGTRARRRDIVCLGDAASQARIKGVEAAIGAKNIIVKYLKGCPALLEQMGNEDSIMAERGAVQRKTDEAEKGDQGLRAAARRRHWRLTGRGQSGHRRHRLGPAHHC